jgi:hypothetical protein
VSRTTAWKAHLQEGIVSKKLDAPYKSGPSDVVENQKSERTGSNTRC